jgi:hypothetical protein
MKIVVVLGIVVVALLAIAGYFMMFGNIPSTENSVPIQDNQNISTIVPTVTPDITPLPVEINTSNSESDITTVIEENDTYHENISDEDVALYLNGNDIGNITTDETTEVNEV